MLKRSAPTEADEAKHGPTNAQIVLRNGLPQRVPPQPPVRDIIDDTLLDARWPLDVVNIVRDYSRRGARIPLPENPGRRITFDLTEKAVLHLVPRHAIPERKIEATFSVIVEHENEQLLAFDANRYTLDPADPGLVTLYCAKTDRDTGIDLYDVKFYIGAFYISWEDLRNGTSGNMWSDSAYTSQIRDVVCADPLPLLRGDPTICKVLSEAGAPEQCVWATSNGKRCVQMYLRALTNPYFPYGGSFDANLRPPNDTEAWCDAENDLITGPESSINDKKTWLRFSLGPHPAGPEYASICLSGRVNPESAITHKQFRARRNEMLACLRQAAKYPHEFRAVTSAGW
jgi:hypothetical protein